MEQPRAIEHRLRRLAKLLTHEINGEPADSRAWLESRGRTTVVAGSTESEGDGLDATVGMVPRYLNVLGVQAA